jgi:hypothetical protein
MTQHRPGGTDLEYDLAHEATGSEAATPRPTPEQAVPVMPPDDGGDYSYDLAHDVPRQ